MVRRETLDKVSREFYGPLKSDDYGANYCKDEKTRMGTLKQVQRISKNNG
jgi:hypothetical protein